MAQFLFVTDLDHTLIGDDDALATLNHQLSQHRDAYGTRIVYSTGRSLASYKILRSQKTMLAPDAVVTGVGTGIFYGDDEQADVTWANYLSQGWDRDRILATTAHFADLTPQPAMEQGPFKISFYLTEAMAEETLPRLDSKLRDQGLEFKLIYSGGKDLDILPRNADKGMAMVFLREKWQFSPSRTVVCGDSGNDRALFSMEGERGIIVGNARPELLEWHQANPSPYRYLATQPYAAGILEGLTYFKFLTGV